MNDDEPPPDPSGPAPTPAVPPALVPGPGFVQPSHAETRAEERVADEAESKALRERAAILRQEHLDLDASIQALEILPLPDQLLIARLKRKKLALRDQIVLLEDQILPDIIA